MGTHQQIRANTKKEPPPKENHHQKHHLEEAHQYKGTYTNHKVLKNSLAIKQNDGSTKNSIDYSTTISFMLHWNGVNKRKEPTRTTT
jgi:hypothetical protein